MNKKFKNIIILTFLLFLAFATVVQADTSLSWDSLSKDAKAFIEAGQNKNLIDDSKIVEKNCRFK